MPAAVSLKDIVIAMDLPNPEWESFLDPESGEIVTVTDEDVHALEDPDPERLPKWQQEALPRVRDALESGRYLRLPDSFEIHEWSIMDRFSRSVEDPDASAELLGAIHGRGAFRLFRATLERLGLGEQWYAYRESEFTRMAREWLDAHGIRYT